MRYLVLTLLFLMFFSGFASSYIFVDSYGISSFSATTNLPSYENGDSLILSGNIGDLGNYDFTSDSIPTITFLIISPLNELVSIGSIIPNSDGSFEHSMIVGGPLWTSNGNYIFKIHFDSIKSEIIIVYSSESSTSPEPEPAAQSTSDSESTQSTVHIELEIASFVDEAKDPQSYIDRYNNEESYKEWFDENYPDYTIEEAVGLPEPVKEKVPILIKNNVKGWTDGNIDDDTFVSDIQFLMNEKIMDIPDLPQQASEKTRPSFVDDTKDPQSYVDRYNNEASYKEWFDENYPDYTIEEAVGVTKPIPVWIKNTAAWWSEGMITEDEFLKGLEYLVEKRILNVN